MSDLLREQLSAFMDGELPREECALLLKRVVNNEKLSASWHHWHLIGDTLRGELTDEQTQQLAHRVDQALNASETPTISTDRRSRDSTAARRHSRRWPGRRSATVAAGVAVLGVAGLVGALVSQQVGGGQVLVPGAVNGTHLGTTVKHVNLQQTPQPVRAELNRYLLMHEVYGPSVMQTSDPKNAQEAATAADTKLATGTGGS